MTLPTTSRALFVAPTPAPVLSPTPTVEPKDEPLLTRGDAFRLGGAVLGGLGCGLIGADLGMTHGMQSSMGVFGSHPLAQVFSLITVGLVMGVRGSLLGTIGGTLIGAAVGAGAGHLLAKATEK